MERQESTGIKAERRREQMHLTDSGICPEILLSIIEGRREFADYKRAVYLFWKSSSVEGYPWTCIPFQTCRLVWTDLSLHAAMLDLGALETEEAANHCERFLVTSDAAKIIARKGIVFLMHSLQGRYMAAFDNGVGEIQLSQLDAAEQLLTSLSHLVVATGRSLLSSSSLAVADVLCGAIRRGNPHHAHVHHRLESAGIHPVQVGMRFVCLL
eukprot:762774-Hanusia_phi.AAC.4